MRPSGEQRDTGHAGVCASHTLCSRGMHTTPAKATDLACGVPLRRTARHRSHRIGRPYPVRMHMTPARAKHLARGVPLRRTPRHVARRMRCPYPVLQRDARSARCSYRPGTQCAPQENSIPRAACHPLSIQMSLIVHTCIINQVSIDLPACNRVRKRCN